MALALFYFLKDGPSMIRSLMWLSPLDDRHEEELLMEFSASVEPSCWPRCCRPSCQGCWRRLPTSWPVSNRCFCSMLLTMLLAMVPFVGAAAVWFPACLWLAFVEQSFVAAIALLALRSDRHLDGRQHRQTVRAGRAIETSIRCWDCSAFWAVCRRWDQSGFSWDR